MSLGNLNNNMLALTQYKSDLEYRNQQMTNKSQQFQLYSSGALANASPLISSLHANGYGNMDVANMNAIYDVVGNNKVAITYGNKVPCIQIFGENNNCIGHMYLDNFQENGENQKNKLILYGNEEHPTYVYQFNDDKQLSQVYDSEGNAKNITPQTSQTTTNNLDASAAYNRGLLGL